MNFAYTVAALSSVLLDLVKPPPKELTPFCDLTKDMEASMLFFAGLVRTYVTTTVTPGLRSLSWEEFHTLAASGASADTLIQTAFDKQAPSQALVESPFTLAAIFSTWVRSLELDPTQKPTILSLGCGPALYEFCLALMMRKLGMQPSDFICLDYAPGMGRAVEDVRNAIAAFCDESVSGNAVIPELIFKLGDMRKREDLPEKVDHIFCNNCLQWVENYEQVIQNIASALRPEGTAAIFMNAIPLPFPLYDHNPSVRWFTLAKLLDLLEANDMAIMSIEVIIGDEQFAQRSGGGMSRLMVKAKKTHRYSLSWRNYLQHGEKKELLTVMLKAFSKDK